MQLRFRVNQAEAFRRGLSVPKSIVRINVEPAELDQEARDIIADRMDGIDVCYGAWNAEETMVVPSSMRPSNEGDEWQPNLILADADTLEALLEAVREDEAIVQMNRAPDRTPRPSKG